jgi:hypothetical protein
VWRFLLIAVVLSATMVGGCRPRPSGDPLEEQDPIFVVPAAAELGDRKRVQADEVRQLVRLLDDPDAAVRLTASQSLYELSGGERFDYHFWQDAADRREAVTRWQAWADDATASER